MCGLVPGVDSFAPSAAAFPILWRDSASEPSIATTAVPYADSLPRNSETGDTSAGISSHTLSTGTFVNEDDACVSSPNHAFALDLFVFVEDLEWGSWEVVLPAAQVPEGDLPQGRLFIAHFPLLRQTTPITLRMDEDSVCSMNQA